MQGRLGAVLTSGLAAIAIALALLQAFVVSRSHVRTAQASASPLGPTNRFSVPGGRSGIPWLPFDREHEQPQPDEARSRPPPKQQEERRAPPPPSRYHSYPPRVGPSPARKATA
jgi:hypothetical protein